MIILRSSFADLVALSPHPYHKPVLKSDGPLVIKSGRHPVISTIQQSTSYVCNDCFLGPPPMPNFLVVSGPNGSGKSTYIKQVNPYFLMFPLLTL